MNALIKTKSGPREITAEKIQELLAAGKILESQAIFSLDNGRSWISVGSALDQLRKADEPNLDDIATNTSSEEVMLPRPQHPNLPPFHKRNALLSHRLMPIREVEEESADFEGLPLGLDEVFLYRSEANLFFASNHMYINVFAKDPLVHRWSK
ncbi:MAG: hypothetical protein N3B15_04745 [Planctomycetota bacterium]|nr:hypothetical protein [Planctomycetota bacterium]MCX8039864.1 hypothetical protein [Planctomycetota bacterium]